MRIRKAPASHHGSYLLLWNPSPHRCGLTKGMVHKNLLPMIPYICLPSASAWGPEQCSDGCYQLWTWEFIVVLCFRGWLDLLLVEKSSSEFVRISRQVPFRLTGSDYDFCNSVLHFYAQIHWWILYFHPVSSPSFFSYEMVAFIRCSL